MVILLLAALAVPAVTGTALILAGRDSMTARQGNANLVSLVASVTTAVLVVATVITRPEVDQSWLPSLGVRWQFAVDGISAPLLLLSLIHI